MQRPGFNADFLQRSAGPDSFAICGGSRHARRKAQPRIGAFTQQGGKCTWFGGLIIGRRYFYGGTCGEACRRILGNRVGISAQDCGKLRCGIKCKNFAHAGGSKGKKGC